jgi:hypothetical protein
MRLAGTLHAQYTAPVVSYVLRRIDPELWKRAKARAASEGRTVRFVLLAFLRVYAEYGFRVVETFDRRERE